MSTSKAVSPAGTVRGRILLIRGKRVIVDADLAHFYGVSTKRLAEQVRRNRDRFPMDFMFRLTEAEKVEMSVFVVRAFVAIRRAITVNSQIAQKLASLERRLADHDDQILIMVRAIKDLAAPPPAPGRLKIGFHA